MLIDMGHGTDINVLKRLKRAHGHLGKVIAMMENEKACLDVTMQLQAVFKAISSAKKEFIFHHIEHCLASSSSNKQMNEFKEITKYL